MPRYIITIQSHVAYGYVGNTAAVFPLQLLGFSPIVINTVQFSNHTNHKTTRGMVFTEEHIRDIILGIRERGLMGKCEGLLSGYLGDASIGQVILDLAKEIKTANPKAVWCCDPVIGDTDSGIFVKPGIPEFMKENFLKGLAELTTPNQFELELLSGVKLESREHAVQVSREVFISKGCHAVFVTSLRTPDVPSDSIETLAVTHDRAWTVLTPFLPQDPTPKGQGDVFAAVAFGNFLLHRNIPQALEHAVSTLYALVNATPLGGLDLPLIDERQQILKPTILFKAKEIL
ncbi:MAG: pyridoxal kinase PdxY [Burkholderiales bacterium]|nr:pyridoxal kinase PdxY [Burkholderiales bacterium]